ncbi:hypothetical protein HELRODRAFT_156445 [Helobdella robusta]|uniref:Gfo/Idh/MocA-like oxidoreductase N-terminal domain-containing protein n=1 Tax=Helobdella robusta TaxID=6412 RepID=T1ELW8_HELRO|nr:hypothetical protein HELRODRAFT_156445 [Helobdella robusta]ESO09338.1 hypothetical protein HELRODRAFT_156445 [Helobdella robusta]
MTSTPVTAVVVGAGSRGFAYSKYALDNPDKFKIVGVAEPRKFQREKLASDHNLCKEKVFSTWEEVVNVPKFADCILVTTMDQMHKDPAVAFAKKGYHIYLEKPMATTYADCACIVETCKRNNVMLAVGHVLRYDSHAQTIRDIIRSGEIGQVVNIQHLEPIGFWHFAHSFVRGNWGNSEKSTFLLLAKCCHDLDLIQMWLGEKDECLSISSFGSLVHFTKKNQPDGASDRCLDCKVESQCAYSAKKLYLGLLEKGHTGWPVSVVADVPDVENVLESLRVGPYGRCVYACDNDVCDNEVVIMNYKSGATVSLTTVAFTEEVCSRHTTICGTKGEITCVFYQPDIKVFNFLTKTKKMYNVCEKGVVKTGHSDSDMEAIRCFVEAIKNNDPSKILTGPEQSLQSHLLCFAAERARVEQRVVQLKDENFITS